MTPSQQKKLLERNLVQVASKALVSRYNEALVALGLEPTTLTRFHIDALGYSFEIAEEKGVDYLSHGPANPLGIILTPNQQKASFYAPVPSFYIQLMYEYYAKFQREIADITKDTAIWLDFDQGLSRYTSPEHLLRLEAVTVHSGAGSLTEAAALQTKLVETFRDDPIAWFNPNFRQKIIESAKEHGDLRDRYLVISPARFDDIDSFYSPAFGGVFVLRPSSGNPYLIVCDRAAYDGLARKRNALYLHDGELIEQLYAENLISVDLPHYAAQPDELRRIYDYLLADLLYDDGLELDFSDLTVPQRRQRLRLIDDVPEVLLELEYLTAKLEAGEKIRVSQLSGNLIRLLLRPTDNVNDHARDVVWKLLARLEGRDISRQYEFDRERFLEAYETWPEAKQAWAVELLSKS